MIKREEFEKFFTFIQCSTCVTDNQAYCISNGPLANVVGILLCTEIEPTLYLSYKGYVCSVFKRNYQISAKFSKPMGFMVQLNVIGNIWD